VIFHLTVIIALLFHQLNIAREMEHTFVMDFTKQEEMERKEKEIEQLQKEIEMKEAVLKNLEKKLAHTTQLSSEFRNVAVNSGNALKDDRNTNMDELNKLAEEVQNKVKDAQKKANEKDNEDLAEQQESGKSGKDKEKKEYSGPSVLTYFLEGRSATDLPIPAYRCYGGGHVTVNIAVNCQGRVIDCWVSEKASSADRCLREFALRAARQTRFTASSTSAERQEGYIVYEFIAQ
jgi:TonB family protein